MQEFTGIRSSLENLQEISKRIQDWRQLGFKFSVELTDKHATTCTGFQLNPVYGHRASALGPDLKEGDYGCYRVL
jgi:hypothetical protein